ncbi:MAG: hypothetical protein KTR31_15895 [Myxococcales bacterium]|nr:hypothetical protein [Myxococcales bacterium]
MLDAWAWALLHFLWQGALIAAVAEVALRSLSVNPARIRYGVACGAMALMVLAPVLTMAVLVGAPGHTVSALSLAPATTAAAPAWTAALVLAWALGVGGLLGRTALGLWAIQRLRTQSIAPSAAVAARFRELSERMGSGFVQLRLVADATVPMAVGWLKPAVLLPASLLARLPPDQLEALLLHELAHVRRMDWLVNLAQSLAETLLFYHPAVWWLSRRIRHERELCCDEAVLACGSSSLSYAKALARVEDLRVMAAPAANGGELMDRILNIVGQPRRVRSARWVMPTLVLAGLIGLTSAGSAVASVVQLDNPVTPMDLDALADGGEEDDERPVAAEDVGARALQMLADYLERGARNLEENAERRFARREARRQARHGSTQGPPPPAEIRPAPPRPPAPPAPPAPPVNDHDHDHGNRWHEQHDSCSGHDVGHAETDCLELPGVTICGTDESLVVELGDDVVISDKMQRKIERKLRKKGEHPFEVWAETPAPDASHHFELKIRGDDLGDWHALEIFEGLSELEGLEELEQLEDLEFEVLGIDSEGMGAMMEEYGAEMERFEAHMERYEAEMEAYAEAVAERHEEAAEAWAEELERQLEGREEALGAWVEQLEEQLESQLEGREEAIEAWAEQMEQQAEAWEAWGEAWAEAWQEGRRPNAQPPTWPVPPAPPVAPGAVAPPVAPEAPRAPFGR